MAKRQKATRFSIQSYDNAHYRATEQYARAVDALFDVATKEISQAVTRGKIDPDKPFSFDDYPKIKGIMQDVTIQLADRLTTTIETGSKKQWLFACKKNDGFIASIFETSKLSKARLNKMQDQNLDALKAFQGRKVDGLNLSERVWKYVGQYREQIETALDVGLGEGRSAQQLARDVKQNLKDPNRLFRRVRDKRGNLVLSKAARAFHPGRGVYRSSVKNAQRLTRSEINMAYRESDWQRWQSLDFVVGFEIVRSNHEPLCDCDICARLIGRYPKTFKFVGWHPQCMCYAIPILMDEETFDENELGDLKAALRGTTYKRQQAKNAVADVPDNFKQWVKDHIEAQKGWSSTPYFIRDNFKNGDLSKGLKIVLPTIQKAAIALFRGNTPQEIKDFIIQNIANSCTLEIKASDLDLWNEIVNQLNTRIKQFGLNKFGNIGVPHSKAAEASWDSFGNNFNLNMTAIRNKSAIKKAAAWKKRGVLYSFAYEDADDYVRAVIDHELGHAILSNYVVIGDVATLMAKVGKTIMVNGKPFNPINDVLGYYASTEEHEFFAEAFSFYMGKNRDKLDERIKDYFANLFSKHGFKLDVNATPKIDPVQRELDALQPQILKARNGCTKWGLLVQLSMLEKHITAKDITGIKTRLGTIHSKVSEMERKDTDIRNKCREWGLNTFPLDDAMKNPELNNIFKAIDELENRVVNAEKEYKNYIQEAQQAIKDANNVKIDAMDVTNDIAAVLGDKREWVLAKANIKDRLRKLLDLITKAKGNAEPTKLDKVFEELEQAKVEYRDVEKLPQIPTDDDIIERVGGGDDTKGSCASLAFAYVANKSGLDVLDFRGGKSWEYFSSRLNLYHICEKIGGYSNMDITGLQLLKQTQIGKTYYVAWARHAAIVRQVSKGKYEYMELQSATSNGWKPLDSKIMNWRFGGRGRDVGLLIDIELLQKDSGFQKMVGYINTAKADQKKSGKGTIK